MLASRNTAEALAQSAPMGPARSLWADARTRFFRNRAAVGGLIVLGLVGLFAAIGPFVGPHDIETIDWAVLGDEDDAGRPCFLTLERLERWGWYDPDDPAADNMFEARVTPCNEGGHWFGVDASARDLFARTVQGTQISLMVGIIGALIAVVVGTLYGAVSGYFGGRTDNVMMRIVDVLMSIPYMFVLILLLVIFGRSILMLFVGIGLISWLDMARIARGQTLSLRGKEFVEAAIATGVAPFTIIMRHVVPNLLGVVIVYATLLVPSMIIYESFISFLGLGVQEPFTSWGALINEGADEMRRALWMLAFPLFFFVVTLFAFFFVGDGLRDALDPKDR